MLKKNFLTAAFVFSFALAPLAHADIISDLQAQISSLLSQVKNLQALVGGSVFGGGSTFNTSTATSCAGGYIFRVNFTVGSARMADVSALTTILKNKEGLISQIGSVYSGPVSQNGTVANAVSRFQQKYGIAAIGSVGPLTRQKLNTLYGCTNINTVTANVVAQASSTQTTISGVSGLQSSYSFGDAINLRVTGIESNGTPASDDKGYNIQAYIWPASDTGMTGAYLTPNPASSYNGTYNSVLGYWTVGMNVPVAGSYNMRLALYCSRENSTCWNYPGGGRGGDTIKIVPFTVSSSTNAQPSITITSPNANGSFIPGQQVAVQYSASNFPRAINVQIQLNKGAVYPNGPFNPIGTATNYVPATGSYLFTIPLSAVPGNNYSFMINSDYPTTETSTSFYSNNFAITASTTVAYPGFLIQFSKPSFSSTENVIATLSRADGSTNPYLLDAYIFTDDQKISLGSLSVSQGTQTSFRMDQFGIYTGPGQYALLVCDAGKVCNGGVNTNAASFSISAPTVQPSITVISPNGGNNFTAGHSITSVNWNTANLPAGISISNFSFLIRGITGSPIYELVGSNADYINNGSSYIDLAIPSTVPAGQYKLDISCASCVTGGGSVSDWSDQWLNVFAVTSTPTITFTAPTVNQQVTAGGTLNITWNKQNILATKPLTLSVYPGPGLIPADTATSVVLKNVGNIPNTGSYTMTIPANTRLQNYNLQLFCNDCTADYGVTTSATSPTFKVVAPVVPPTVTAVLNSTTDDKAGIWGNFGPGIGNGNRTAGDWNWTATLNLPVGKTVKSIGVSRGGEGWSTSNSALYPLVVIENGIQYNNTYGQQFTFGAGTHTLKLYGQKESSFVITPILTITFSDNTTISTNISTVTTVVQPTVTVSTDSSSPSYKIVAASTVGVTAGVYRFRATNGPVSLQQIALKLTKGSSNDLVTVKIFDGATQVGTAVFVGNSLSAISTLTPPVLVTPDTDKVLTIKVDLESIGVSQPVTNSGHMIAVDIDNTNATGTYGTGVSSGARVNVTGATSVAGLRVFRSVPIVAITSNGGTLAQGTDLYKFTVTNPNSRDVVFEKFSFSIATTPSGNVSAFTLYGDGVAFNTSTANTDSVGTLLEISAAVTSQAKIIAANSTKTYILKAATAVDTASVSETISIALLADTSYPLFPLNTSMGSVSAVDDGSGNTDNIIWSPFSTTTPVATSATESNQDWTNGYGLPGFPANTAFPVQTWTRPN